MSPCDHRERCGKNVRYGYHSSLKIHQREYCFETVSRSGPNINPPNRNAAVAIAEKGMLCVATNAAANAGAARRNVIASWVFPLGIN